VVLIEGVLGLFDGVPGEPWALRTSKPISALRFGLPVAVGSWMCRAVAIGAAVLRGFSLARYRSPDPRRDFSRIGRRAPPLLIVAIAIGPGLRCSGAVLREECLTLPEAYLRAGSKPAIKADFAAAARYQIVKVSARATDPTR